jgi:hypothetical protein
MTDHPEVPEGLFHLQAGRERAKAVGRLLIGLHLDEARDLAANSNCQVRLSDATARAAS